MMTNVCEYIDINNILNMMMVNLKEPDYYNSTMWMKGHYVFRTEKAKWEVV